MFLISVIDFLFELRLMSLLFGVVLNLSHRPHLRVLTQPNSSTPLNPTSINLHHQLKKCVSTQSQLVPNQETHTAPSYQQAFLRFYFIGQSF